MQLSSTEMRKLDVKGVLGSKELNFGHTDWWCLGDSEQSNWVGSWIYESRI